MQMTTAGRLGRYFLHGIFYSLLMSIILLMWAFILGLLVAIGSILGLVVAFVLLFIFIGAVNAFVTESVWGVDVETSLGTDFVHGLILFIVLLIISFPVSIVFDYLVPVTDVSLAVLNFVVRTIVLAFVDGYVAKGIAGGFERE